MQNVLCTDGTATVALFSHGGGRAARAANLAVVSVAACSDDQENRPLELSGDPFVGLACRAAYQCDRVLVSVVVVDAVERVTAQIDGRSITLQRPDGGTPQRPRAWRSVLKFPGAQRRADVSEPVALRVRAVPTDGSQLEVTSRIPLARGSG